MFPRATAAASRAVHATVLAFVLITVVSVAAASTAAAVPGIGVIRLGESASIGSSNLPKYATVILAPHKYTFIPQIKSASPGTRVLVYKNPLSIVGCPNVHTCSAGVTLAQARAHDAAYPNDPWILRDATGKPVRHPGFSYFWLGNVGSASYRQPWVANVAKTMRLGWDGVDVDDVLAQISGWSKGVYPKLFPSDAAWERAMAGFMAYVGPQLKARGSYVLASAYKYGRADGSDTAAWWKKVGRYVSGLMREYWVQNPNNLSQIYDTNPCCWTGNWNGWLRLADAAKSVGAHFFPLMSGSSTDTRTMMYGKASFLLVWDGSGGGFIFNPTDAVDPWNQAWTTDIGTPRAPRYQVGVGWRRDYSAGVALVNPNAFSAQTFNLGGSYLTPSGATVTSVTLRPVTAVVLRSASAAVKIARIYFDSPRSEHRSNSSLNAEWIRLRNIGSRAVSLRGWTIQDRSRNVFRFRTYRLRAGKTVTVHTGRGMNRAGHLHWGRRSYIWNNNGDTATLRRPSGTLVDRCRYGGAGRSVTC